MREKHWRITCICLNKLLIYFMVRYHLQIFFSGVLIMRKYRPTTAFTWHTTSYRLHHAIKAWNNNTPSCHGEITLSKIDVMYPNAIPNQISTISMHISSLVKICWELLKLLSWKENTNVLRADNSTKHWQNLPISNPKPDLYNINACTKFGENPLIFTQVIVWKRKSGRTDRHTTDELTDVYFCVSLHGKYPCVLKIRWHGLLLCAYCFKTLSCIVHCTRLGCKPVWALIKLNQCLCQLWECYGLYDSIEQAVVVYIHGKSWLFHKSLIHFILVYKLSFRS